MNIVVDDLLTIYHRGGSGKPVVLLHGWGDSAQTFAALQATLSEDYDTVVLDLPGFGKTQAPTSTWGLTDYAQFVTKALQKLNISKPYALIGHSNGGAIAIKGLGQGLLHTDKLVLLSAAGIRSEYRARKKVLRLAAKAAKAATAPLPRRLRDRLRRRAYRTIGSDLFIAEHLQETFKRIVSDDVQSDARHIAIPTLLIYGEHDTATPPHYGKLFHQAIPDSQLIILPGAGHAIYQDKPEHVAYLIKEFLGV
ncbi:alpha/beta hydrolase [Candidatus Saccharibacteria bacterium]|nr:alpha/beta hydrolase [Candidatus Saccharibacteria bacterium]